MKKIYLIFLLIILSTVSHVLAAEFCVYEANYPNVKDYNVNVDTASLSIRPQGAYVEMDLELTVSYDFKSWFFKNYTELEFMWQFTLPDQAVVDDFWIWVGDSILKPTIMDKWTAQLLFSEVSSPVRNPGLLIQSFPDREGQVAHYLRLYPIMRNEKRKFKIHYLLPVRPTNETLRVWLPTSQLSSRYSPGVDSLNIFFLNEQQPAFIGAAPAYEIYQPALPGWAYKIGLDFNRFVELVYPTPITEKFFFSNHQDRDETFYQLAVYPPEVQQQRTPRNFLILVDFNRFNTDGMDGELILLLLKETMQQTLSHQDSANIIVSYEDPTSGASQFLSCTETNIDLLFENILRRSFPAYSNLQVLFAAAAQFLEKKDSTDVMMLTNTDEISLETYSRDELADEIIAMFAPGTRFHIVDLENKSSLIYNYNTSQYETQLQSFYGRLCYQSAGNLFFLRYHAIKNILAALFYEKISHFEEVEVQTRFAAGYAYGKHFLSLHEGYYPFHFPMIQVGRYRGSLPVDVTVLGKIRLDKAQDSFTINDEDVIPGNRTLMTSWYGDHLHQLLKQQQTNATISEIMDISLKQNILTPYTGFLIFRPEENNGYQEDEDDEPDTPTFIDSLEIDSLVQSIEFSAFPNPFNEVVTLDFCVPIDMSAQVSLAIYNNLGQKVKDFEITETSNRITWQANDGNYPVASGMYFAVLSGHHWKRSVKILLLK